MPCFLEALIRSVLIRALACNVQKRQKLLRRKRSRMFHLDHVEGDGRLLVEQIVAMDPEGIVCKRKDSPYKVTVKPSWRWIKVKNSRYSQLEGREELFEEQRN